MIKSNNKRQIEAFDTMGLIVNNISLQIRQDGGTIEISSPSTITKNNATTVTTGERVSHEKYTLTLDKPDKENMGKKTKKKVKNIRKPKPVNNGEDNDHHGEDVEVDYLDSPIKSETDDNEYRVLKLPNEMVALLVACPEGALGQSDIWKRSAATADNNVKSYADHNDRCTCCSPGWFDTTMMQAETIAQSAFIYVTVGAGRFSDPRQIPGVSHLVSSCILGRSNKYPDEDDDCKQFVDDCGGEYLNFDSADTTTFAVRVPHNKFLEVLDRLSSCFISPLINRDDINRLLHEISVFSGLLNRVFVDAWGKRQVFASFASARHPVKALVTDFHKGMCEMPADQVSKEVMKFRERHYSSHRMTVVLKAKLPLETLEVYAKKYFSKVPNNRMPPRDLSQYNFANSFDTPKSRRIYTMKPIKDDYNYALELNWTLPPSHWLYRSKPRDYLAWLIKHAGEGSLVSYLRKKHWCNEITTGDNDKDFTENSIYCLFSMKIVLTQEGHKNHKKILDAAFSYINLLRRTGPQERIFDELRKIEDAKFRFSRNFEPADHEDLCTNMHLYPPIDYLTGSSLYLEYDHVSLKTCIDLLTPERTTIVVYDKDYKNGNKTQAQLIEEAFFYGFGCGSDNEPYPKFYTSTEIPEDWINHWKIVEPMQNFHLPKPNIFLPDDFTLIPAIKDPPRYPVKVYSDALSEVWYKPDSTFRLPHYCMNFRYVTPLAMTEPENAAMLDLFVEALKHVMLEELYPTAGAALKYEIKACEKGLIVEADGFNQKMPFLMEKISKYIADCPKLVTEDLFKKIKLEQEEKYRESLHESDELCEQLRLSIVRLVHWTCLDKETALAGIKFKHFQHFLDRFADHVYLQCLVQGNISKAAAIESTRECVKLSNFKQLSPNTMPQLRIHEIPRGQRRCRVKNFDSNAKVSTAKNYYQIGDATSHRLSVMIDLFIMMMTDSIFRAFRNAGYLDDDIVVEKHTLGMLGYSLRAINKNHKIQHDPLLDRIHVTNVETIEDIAANIEDFRKKFNASVKSLPERALLGIKNILLADKQQRDESLRTEVSRNWLEITSGNYCFNRREQEVAALNALGVDETRKWLAHLTTDASKLRMLSIQVCSGKEITCDSRDRKIKRDKGDPDRDYKYHQQHRLTYLTDLPKGKEEKRDYYITDIEDFKIGLQVLPLVRKATLPVATAAAASKPPATTTRPTKPNPVVCF